MKKHIRQWLAAAALALPTSVFAAGADIPLDKAPIDPQNVESLQRGAQIFANYCLSCHSAQAMRFNRLTDLYLSEKQIKENLMFTTEKIGDQMKIAMTTRDAAEWFGAQPPDLSLIARARGADFIYSYLRGFYRDESRPTGWNNKVFDKVGMPHVLYEWQGDQVMQTVKDKDGHEVHELTLAKAGTLTKIVDGKADTSEFDERMADLTNFLVYIGEPSQVQRQQIGYVVLMFLILLLFPFTYFLKREYWKDVH